MPLQIIGAGFGRTSTHSLYLALEILGYKTQHMVKLMLNINAEIDVWNRAFDNPNHEDEWEKVYGEYQAAVDFPTCLFYKELSEKYPDAKIILTVRSAKSWFKSIHNTIFKEFAKGTDHTGPHRKRIVGMLKHTLFNGLMEKNPEKIYDEEYMCKVFNDHIEEVKNTIPKERLLVMNMGDGWGPLCEFLGKPIPDESYPITNTSADFQKLAESIRKNDIVTIVNNST